MASSSIKKPYFLLQQPQRVDDDIFDSLLGLVVQDPYKPLEVAYRPSNLKAREAIDQLYPPTCVVCTDFTRVEKRAKKGTASAKFQSMITQSLEKANSNTDKLEAAVFRRVSMFNARTKIKHLLSEHGDEDDDAVSPSAQGPGKQQDTVANDKSTQTEGATEALPNGGNTGGLWAAFTNLVSTPTPVAAVPDAAAEEEKRKAIEAEQKAEQERNRTKYRDQVLKFLREERRLYVITGFLTCSELTKNKEHISSKSIDTTAGTGHASLPPYVDVKLGAAYESTKDSGTSGAYQGECLIACSYLPLYLVQKRRGVWDVLFGRNDDDTEVFIAPKEIWRLGEGEEGNMAVTLGQVPENDDENEHGMNKDDDKFGVGLFYREDEAEYDSFGSDDSEDEK